MSKFTISTGELIDRLSIANIKVWKAEEAFNIAKSDKEHAKWAKQIRIMNRERSEMREELNERLDNRQRGTKKMSYGLGRDQ